MARGRCSSGRRLQLTTEFAPRRMPRLEIAGRPLSGRVLQARTRPIDLAEHTAGGDGAQHGE